MSANEPGRARLSLRRLHKQTPHNTKERLGFKYIIPSSSTNSISTASHINSHISIIHKMSSKPSPQIQHLFLPSPSDPVHSLDLIASLLTPPECTSLISSHTDLIPSNVTPGTIRTREQFSDPALSEEIWSRMQKFYSGDRIQDEDGEWWRAKGLNSMFRLCKYESGLSPFLLILFIV
jgi:hypothetical protein